MENNNDNVVNENTVNEDTQKEEVTNDSNYVKDNVNDNLTEIKETTKATEYGSIVHPSNSKREYNRLFTQLSTKDMQSEKYTSKEQMAMLTAVEGSNGTSLNDPLLDNINNKDNKYVNQLSYGDTELNTRKVSIRSKEGLSNSATVLKFLTFTGQGEIIQVPLWHSGFWVTLTPITQKELINLSIALNDSQITLGRSTSSLIYSNYSVVFIKILTDFIVNHITDSTLTLGEDDDIRDYILLPDLYLLINGMISSMYPTGIDLIKGCINTTVLNNKTGKPKCTYIVEGKVDPKKLLWVNRKVLTKDMLNQMCSRRAKSVTINDVKEYQNNLQAIKDKTINIEINGNKIEITLHTPSLSKTIDSGNSWVENVIKEVESLFRTDDTDAIKESKTTDILVSIKANTYKHYVKEIKFEDVSVSDPVVIEEYLNTISIRKDTVTTFFKEVTNYITNSAIAIIATPNYTCPVCKADQTELSGDFKEFIPLNVLESFFDLSDLRLKRLRENGIF